MSHIAPGGKLGRMSHLTVSSCSLKAMQYVTQPLCACSCVCILPDLKMRWKQEQKRVYSRSRQA